MHTVFDLDKNGKINLKTMPNSITNILELTEIKKFKKIAFSVINERFPKKEKKADNIDSQKKCILATIQISLQAIKKLKIQHIEEVTFVACNRKVVIFL